MHPRHVFPGVASYRCHGDRGRPMHGRAQESTNSILFTGSKALESRLKHSM